MDKRIEQKKQKSAKLIQRMQRVLAIFFCIGLFVFFITATDMSTRKMIMSEDDKYALAVSQQEDNLLRLDIAGEKYLLNIEPVIRLTDSIVSGSKRCYESIADAVRSKK